MPRIACLATDPLTTRVLMAGLLAYLKKQQGFEVTLIAAPGADLEATAAREGVDYVSVPMTREISPWQDWNSLKQLTQVLRDIRPEIVNAGTPKAGLLGMQDARWARGSDSNLHPARSADGDSDRLQTAATDSTERTAAACAHMVICVSPSLRDAFVKYRLGSASKSVVLGGGVIQWCRCRAVRCD